MRIDRNSDITRNVKLIEWMKNEILMSVSELFNILFKGVKSADEALQDILANIIMITYLLIIANQVESLVHRDLWHRRF